MEIPLRNKKKEIIGYTKVSSTDFELVNKYKWNKDKKKHYVKGCINGKAWKLHRFIMIKILGNELIPKQQVDHINNDPLDNTRDNLRVSTSSENNRNKLKKDGYSSKFRNVSKEGKKFKVQISIENKTISARYDSEIHAAWHFNLWIDEYNLKTAVKNTIDIPEDFILYKAKKNKYNLPEGISKNENGKRYEAKIIVNNKTIYLGRHDLLKDAIKARNNAELKRNQDREDIRMALPIQINEQGFCFFTIKNTQVIIDQYMFHELMKYSWFIDDGYVRGTVNKRRVGLSRFIMDCPEHLVVDHKNNNTFDNRQSNLRVLTVQENNMNKSSVIGSSSKYVGVYLTKSNKWRSTISVNGKNIQLGSFLNEIDAAKARDVATLKYRGEIGKLNFKN